MPRRTFVQKQDDAPAAFQIVMFVQLLLPATFALQVTSITLQIRLAQRAQEIALLQYQLHFAVSVQTFTICKLVYANQVQPIAQHHYQIPHAHCANQGLTGMPMLMFVLQVLKIAQ